MGSDLQGWSEDLNGVRVTTPTATPRTAGSGRGSRSSSGAPTPATTCARWSGCRDRSSRGWRRVPVDGYFGPATRTPTPPGNAGAASPAATPTASRDGSARTLVRRGRPPASRTHRNRRWCRGRQQRVEPVDRAEGNCSATARTWGSRIRRGAGPGSPPNTERPVPHPHDLQRDGLGEPELVVDRRQRAEVSPRAAVGALPILGTDDCGQRRMRSGLFSSRKNADPNDFGVRR